MTDKKDDHPDELDYLRDHVLPLGNNKKLDFKIKFWGVLNYCLQEDLPMPDWVKDYLKKAADEVWAKGDFSLLTFKNPGTGGGRSALARYRQDMEIEIRGAAKFAAEERGFKDEGMVLIVNKLLHSQFLKDVFKYHPSKDEFKERIIKSDKCPQGRENIYASLFEEELNRIFKDRDVREFSKFGLEEFLREVNI